MIELPIHIAAPDVTHSDALAYGTRLGEFEIRGLIGVGGFGMVYRAYDHSLQRDVAIKEYMPTAMAGRGGDQLKVAVRASSDHESFQTGLQSFMGEARMLAMFEHPSLVRVFRFWEANGTAYMVMPLYRGMTLKQARQCMRLPPTEAWLRKVMWSILGALKVLHRGKALHRDVSPDNIFLQDVGPPVLLDLGAARLALGDNAKPHTAILKVNYAPIEQYADAQGLPQGPWTDLYALAAVVHGMLCNDAPLPATIRVVSDRMPAFGNVVKTVTAEYGQRYSDQFVDGIAWALRVQPQDRPQSVREFARILGLSTPNGMSSFDWRAELGGACLPAGDVLQLSAIPVTEDKTRPNDTDPDYAPTQFIGSDEDPDPDATLVAQVATPVERRNRPRTNPVDRPAPIERDSTARRKPHSRSPAKHPAATRQRPVALWVMVAVLALSTLAAAAWGVRSWSIKGTPSTVNLPAPQEMLTDIATLPTSSASGPASTAPNNAALEPIDVISESIPPARPASAAAVAVDNAAKASARARTPAAKPAKPEPPRPPAVVEAASAPAPAAPPPPAPEPKLAAPVVTPERLCADTNFLSRPMCMFHACQRPDLSGTATCVELQKSLQRSNDINKF